MPWRSGPPSNKQAYTKAFGLAGGGLAAVLLIVLAQRPSAEAVASPAPAAPSAFNNEVAAATAAPAPSAPEPDTNRLDLKVQGGNCSPPDTVGLGPYAPYRDLSIGRIAIPQKGGHTSDWGYDVIIHFHGHDGIRRVMAAEARGAVFVGMDIGLLSGAYTKAFTDLSPWTALKDSIEKALKAHSGQDAAHIRHVGLSAWSAGYGAVERIVRRHTENADAVVLLDGLHTGFMRTAKPDGSPDSLDMDYIRGIGRFAKRAVKGEKLFVFTHSQIETEGYASTTLTGRRLLRDLGVEQQRQDPGVDAFGQHASAEQQGFYMWSFKGDGKPAHCAHLHLMSRALKLVEARWQTPEMDRSVEPTPGPPQASQKRVEGKLVLESAEPRRHNQTTPSLLPAPGVGPAPAPKQGTPDPAADLENFGSSGVDTGGLEPMPLGPGDG